MKKILLFCFLLVAISKLSAQVQVKKTTPKATDTIVVANSVNPSYRLYPTKNLWNFLKLNTRTGEIWQVQFDVPGDNRFETTLNEDPLVTKEKELDGRFILCPTENTWTFLLLDQIDGRVWQVQWSINAKDRLIVRIY